MDTLVRSATMADAPALRELLARGLADDPLMQWFFDPSREAAETRLSRIAMYFGPEVDWLVGAGCCDVLAEGAEVVAAALWIDPGLPRPSGLPAMAELSTILMPPGHGETTRQSMAAAREGAPELAGSYLSVLAVDPGRTGAGLGARLLAASSRRRTGPRWLETANPRNHSFYARQGYRVVHSGVMAPSGVTLTRMCAGQ